MPTKDPWDSDEDLWIDTQTQPNLLVATGPKVPRAWLRIVHPPELTKRRPIPLEGLPVVIGRSEGKGASDVVRHLTVSRRHFIAQVDLDRGVHIGADLDSYNGTRVNGEIVEIAPVDLTDGSLIRVGSVLFVYERRLDTDTTATTDVRLPGVSLVIERLRSLIAQAAADPSPALIVGNTGTGKENVAAELHRLSKRKGPFVAINCAELSANLVESQLFGHVRGAFTGASESARGLFRDAHGGTLFLDEIGELPLELQPKLLRVLEQGEVRPVGSSKTFPVDVRVVAATNRDLPALVQSAQFRRDLYARMSLWELYVPPLQERIADILGWFDVFAAQWAKRRGVADLHIQFDANAAETLLLHTWPDNLRGIHRLVHRFAEIARSGREITADDVAEALPPSSASTPVVRFQTPRPKPNSRATMPAEVRRSSPRPAPDADELRDTLHRLGSVRATAKHYERDRKQIYRWIKRFGIEWNG